MMDPDKPLWLPESYTKLAEPDLSPEEYDVSQLLASIYTLAREAHGKNMTDNNPMTLDKVGSEMVNCIKRWVDGCRAQTEEENE